MANPVFAKSESFNSRPGYAPAQQGGYSQPLPPGAYPAPGYPQQPGYAPQPTGAVMTLDDVLAKTGLMLLGVFAVAGATFMVMPAQLLLPAVIASGLVGFVTAIIVAGRRNISAGGVMFYALVEGIFVGAFSKFFETIYPGIVVSAVLATFVAAGATLAAYKFLNIRVTPRMRKFVTIATMALAGVLLVNLGLALFGIDTGLRDVGSGAGMLSIIVSVIAVGLAVFNLIIDFDFVERGIANRAPARESWRAAFGITVTMVWLYVEMLRILSYFRD